MLLRARVSESCFILVQRAQASRPVNDTLVSGGNGNGSDLRSSRWARCHKRSVTACARVPSGSGSRRRSERESFGTTINQLVELRSWLVARQVGYVAMEATGVFWMPVWDLLAPAIAKMDLVNARYVKMLPGRKTHMSDAAWLAHLAEAGLLRGSFVPPQPQRDLRDLTRYRARAVQQRTQQSQRTERLLETAGIKLASVVSKTFGVSGRAMLDALVAGDTNPVRLADLAKGTLRSKRTELAAALENRFTDHHRQMLGTCLEAYDFHNGVIESLNRQIADATIAVGDRIELTRTIPGVDLRTAEVFAAEIGFDMSIFPTADHLAAWCGVAPGNNESAGKQRRAASSKTNPWLANALRQAGWAASRTSNTFLSTRYRRLVPRLGPQKAVTAVAHSIIVGYWHMHTTNEPWIDLGTDWYDKRRDPNTEARRLTRKLEALGHTVTLT